jgi:four helix bundle protein
MKSIEELDVFILSHKIVIEIYEITKRFPEEEKFGLSSQMRRSSASISMNLVEGAGRNNKKEFHQFVGIAKGSANELRYQVVLSKDLGYLSEEKFSYLFERCLRVIKMLSKLEISLR